MTLQQIIHKLRTAADILEELLPTSSTPSNETPLVAARIRATLKPRKRAGERQKTALPHGMKGKHYKPGTHWTQRPENRARVKKFAKAGAAVRNQRRSSAVKGKKFKPGTHWTQTPEGKLKMAIAQKKVWATRKAHLRTDHQAEFEAIQ